MGQHPGAATNFTNEHEYFGPPFIEPIGCLEPFELLEPPEPPEPLEPPELLNSSLRPLGTSYRLNVL